MNTSQLLTSKIGSLIDVHNSKDPNCLQICYCLVQVQLVKAWMWQVRPDLLGQQDFLIFLRQGLLTNSCNKIQTAAWCICLHVTTNFHRAHTNVPGVGHVDMCGCLLVHLRACLLEKKMSGETSVMTQHMLIFDYVCNFASRGTSWSSFRQWDLRFLIFMHGQWGWFADEACVFQDQEALWLLMSRLWPW